MNPRVCRPCRAMAWLVGSWSAPTMVALVCRSRRQTIPAAALFCVWRSCVAAGCAGYVAAAAARSRLPARRPTAGRLNLKVEVLWYWSLL